MTLDLRLKTNKQLYITSIHNIWNSQHSYNKRIIAGSVVNNKTLINILRIAGSIYYKEFPLNLKLQHMLEYRTWF